jgi:hypothetical protein
MKSACVDLSFVGNPADLYPEGALADAAEARIALSLPAIPELAGELDDEERQTILASTAARQRLDFVKMNGDPFGDFCVQLVSKVPDATSSLVAAL